MPDDGRNSNAKNDVLFYSRLFGLRAGRHGLVLRRTCGCRACGANTSSSNDTGAFQYRIKVVGCQAGESLRFTGRSEDFHMFEFGSGAKPEMQAQIVLRKGTAAAVNRIRLRDT